ncbi:MULTISPECIES: tetratricopeptide repeat protein [Nostoc]|uniref:Tetratricopeptide repeat protein n=2 Tax=Nostoc TaxID=1177 RepID=A0ABR8IIR8_9NOSO|nr:MULTISPECIES: hypothetical protein [Nostoc]MBD2560514.1 hypothetical protein [Nostoc linckia FACHB-391]MBD2651059.1 hypothetical protein [Nostoc foliaceum FACHB-393]
MINQNAYKNEFNNKKFSDLIENIPSAEGRLEVLKCLVENFPDEAHFWGHLARFYSIALKQYKEALEAVEKAINLSPSDHVLYHMKGMCLRSKLYELMDECNNKNSCHPEKIEEIEKLVIDAGKQFSQTREIDQNNEPGYISHIQMLIRVIEFGYSVSNKANIEEFIASDSSGWYLELLDLAEDLLENVRRLGEGEKSDKFVIQCQGNLANLYGDYNQVIQRWNSLLDDRNIYHPPIRRQLVRAYIARRSNSWNELKPKEIDRVIQLLEQNLLQEPESDKNIRLWFQATRRYSRANIDTAIEKLTYWRGNTGALDATYYLYILYVIKALNGSTLAVKSAQELIRKSLEKSENLRNRNFSFEWYGNEHENGIKKLIAHKELGDKDKNTEFYRDVSKLSLVSGRITSFKGRKAGTIQLACGLEAFFVPSREGYTQDKDNNKRVKFYLGFSYTGLRASKLQDA